MKILITGATGLVGKALGLNLCRDGHHLTIVSRRAATARQSCPFPCEIIEGDLSRNPIPHLSNDYYDVVINLIGESIASGSWTESKKQELTRSRVNATENLVSSLSKQPPSLLISATAIGIYGDAKDTEITENTKSGSNFLAELCAQWEASALKLSSTKTRVVLPRIGLVITRRGGFLKELQTLFQSGLAGRLGSGKQWMSPIHIDDLVKIFRFAMSENSIQGPLNAVGPAPLTNEELTSEMGRCFGRPTIFPAPSWGLQLALGEKAHLLLSSQRVYPKVLLERGFKFQYPTFRMALEAEFPENERGIERFTTQQYIPQPPTDIFPFFAEAKNLEKITPPSLHFEILKMSTAEIQKGTQIDYALRLHGIPIKWKTEIETWNPPHVFVDNQIKGPYSLWHHTHQFERLGPGTLMTDTVRYKLPLGYLGWLGGRHQVEKEVLSIFSYRQKIVGDLFSSFKK